MNKALGDPNAVIRQVAAMQIEKRVEEFSELERRRLARSLVRMLRNARPEPAAAAHAALRKIADGDDYGPAPGATPAELAEVMREWNRLFASSGDVGDERVAKGLLALARSLEHKGATRRPPSAIATFANVSPKALPPRRPSSNWIRSKSITDDRRRPYCRRQCARHAAIALGGPLGQPFTPGRAAARGNRSSRRATPTPQRQQTLDYRRVIDASGPVPGARVRLQACPTVVLTDAQGNFRLPAEGDSRIVTAAKPGYYVAAAERGSDPLQIELQRPAEPDAAEYAWVDPTPDASSPDHCGNCHAAIFDQWQSSAHAAGLANRHFLNLYEGSDWHRRPRRGWSLLDEHPDGAGVCASCHAPAAELDDPRFDDLRSIDGLAAGGVQCDFCHKVQDVAIDRVGWQHGRFAMTLLRPASSRQVFLGPLDDANRGDDVYSPLQSESRYCAACHEGVVFGVPVYSTYSEWLASPAKAQGKQCQSCHMAPDGEMHNIAPGAGGSQRAPETLASHDLLPGGKAAMLRRALHLTAQVVSDDDPRSTRILEITLQADQVGHRLPTGFIDRHLILSVEARDVRGQPVEMVAGPRLPPPVGGALVDRPGVLWAKLLTDTQGESPAPFWRAGVTLADTRLAPGEPSASRYTLPAAAATVDVRLIFRRFWESVAREKDWPRDDILVIEKSLPLADKR